MKGIRWVKQTLSEDLPVDSLSLKDYIRVIVNFMKLIKIVFFTFLFLSLLATRSEAATPPSETSYDTSALIQINLKSYPRTEVVRVQGGIDGKNNNVGDLDGDGKLDIETEILSMNLTGVNPTLGEVSFKNGLQDKKNMRTGEQISNCRRFQTLSNASCAANSFFDIFIEMRHTPFHNSAAPAVELTEVLTSCEQVHLNGISRSLTNLSGFYNQRMSGKISLCNRSGEPVGTINFLAVNLNSSKSN